MLSWCNLRLFSDYDERVLPTLDFFVNNYNWLLTDELRDLHSKYNIKKE